MIMVILRSLPTTNPPRLTRTAPTTAPAHTRVLQIKRGGKTTPFKVPAAQTLRFLFDGFCANRKVRLVKIKPHCIELEARFRQCRLSRMPDFKRLVDAVLRLQVEAGARASGRLAIEGRVLDLDSTIQSLGLAEETILDFI